jgi:hypothetical protein
VIIWWPRQIPNVGYLGRRAVTVLKMYVSAAGSPGPLERKTQSGRCSSTWAADAAAGNTWTSKPCRTSLR